MSRRYAVLIMPSAEAEIEEAYLWMQENHSPERAVRWRKQVLEAASKLERFPKRGAVAHDAPPGGRVHAIVVAPYRVLYIIHERTVAIVHVMHGARRPGFELPE